MSAERYEELVRKKLGEWRGEAFGDDVRAHVVQDHEKCLWKPTCLQALKDAKCFVVDSFPKHSPDLNAIEGVWRLLKERLEATAPASLETRSSFLRRVRHAIAWLNETKHNDLMSLCNNQKVRAQEVLSLDGAKSSF